MTPEQIFDHVGLSKEEIISILEGKTQMTYTIARQPDGKLRPICLVCHQPVGKHTCKPFPQPPLSLK